MGVTPGQENQLHILELLKFDKGFIGMQASQDKACTYNNECGFGASTDKQLLCMSMMHTINMRQNRANI